MKTVCSAALVLAALLSSTDFGSGADNKIVDRMGGRQFR